MYSKIKKITLWFITLLAISFMSCSNGFDDNNTENANLPSGYYVLADKSAYIQVSDATGYLYEYDSSVLGYKKMDLPLAISLSGSTVYFSWSTTVNSQTFSGKISGTYTESTKSVMITAVDENSKDYAAIGSIYTWQNTKPVYSGSDDNSENTDNYAFSAPNDVTATISTTTSNTIVIKWTNVTGVSDYWLYYNTENNTDSAILKSKYAYSGYMFTINESGTYYFWIKSANGTKETSAFSKVAVCTISYESLSVPSNFTVSLSTITANTVKLSWSEEKASYSYWIYYGTTNDSSQATLKSKYGYKGYTMQLTENGTYYFWVKAANESTSTSATSDFSNSSSITFTHEDLSAPTALTATGTNSTVKLTWTATKTTSGLSPASYYIYYGTENDSSKATLKSKYGYSGYEITLSESGTYYFWVKAADTSDSSSPTSDFSEVATYGQACLDLCGGSSPLFFIDKRKENVVK